MKKIFFAVIAAFTLFIADAQLKTPAPSPTQTIKQDFGLADVELSYSRPGVKGRKIFGDLVPFGKVWRTGAKLPVCRVRPRRRVQHEILRRIDAVAVQILQERRRLWDAVDERRLKQQGAEVIRGCRR